MLVYVGCNALFISSIFFHFQCMHSVKADEKLAILAFNNSTLRNTFLTIYLQLLYQSV